MELHPAILCDCETCGQELLIRLTRIERTADDEEQEPGKSTHITPGFIRCGECGACYELSVDDGEYVQTVEGDDEL